jgi:hypothetical protein
MMKRSCWLAVAMAMAAPSAVLTQAGLTQAGQPGRGQAAGPAAAGARAAAPVDLTGYWVSIVTEDWIERMSPSSPPSGIIGGGRGGGGGGGGGGRGGGGAAPAVAPSTDPCRVYAAGGSMRVPGRLNVTWADDNTLKIDMDAGTQTRLLHFNAPQPSSLQKTLQGYSVATWDAGARAGGFGGGGGGGGAGRGQAGAPAAAPAPRWGVLRVVTTNLSGGYLLSSRSHYSDNAVLTEQFMKHSDFGVDYVTVTATVQDGAQNRIVSSTFKKEPDGSRFAPSGCDVVP